MGSAFIQAIKGSERPRRGAGENFFPLLALRKSHRETRRCRPFLRLLRIGIFRVDLELGGGEGKAPPFHCLKSIALSFLQKPVSLCFVFPLRGFRPTSSTLLRQLPNLPRLTFWLGAENCGSTVVSCTLIPTVGLCCRITPRDVQKFPCCRTVSKAPVVSALRRPS